MQPCQHHGQRQASPIHANVFHCCTSALQGLSSPASLPCQSRPAPRGIAAGGTISTGTVVGQAAERGCCGCSTAPGKAGQVAHANPFRLNGHPVRLAGPPASAWRLPFPEPTGGRKRRTARTMDVMSSHTAASLRLPPRFPKQHSVGEFLERRQGRNRPV